MTSGTFKSVAIEDITILRDDRQRRELRNVPELAESIAARGLIHPIVITRDHVLVAGERRLAACHSLGWSHIPAQFTEELSDEELHLIELEENTKRVDITWQEQVAAVTRYHEIRSNQEPNWTAAATARALGMSNVQVSETLSIGERLADPSVANAPTYSTARSVVQRAKTREKTSTLKAVAASVPTINADGEPIPDTPEAPPPPLVLSEFQDFMSNYSGPAFNFLHCDFPYGINANTAPTTASGSAFNTTAAQHLGGYEDDPEVYFKLLREMSCIPVADSAHMMFWFPMKFYDETLRTLSLSGWHVNPYPLVWHKSDNTGVLPDPQYGFRRTYETAFHCSRGKRPIVQSVAGSFAFPGKSDTRIHMSEKPIGMLRHFFRMYVDEHTNMLDPTCGSATSVRAALELGAGRVLGIERDEEFFNRASEAWGS